MKLRYQKQEIFAYAQALEVLDKQDNMIMVEMTEQIFKNYGKFLDKHYNSFKLGTIQKNHIFRVDKCNSSLSMRCATHEGATGVIQPMIKRGVKICGERKKEMEEYSLEIPKPTGLRLINQVGLYKKFRPYVPHQ
jgi:hypothetical protein